MLTDCPSPMMFSVLVDSLMQCSSSIASYRGMLRRSGRNIFVDLIRRRHPRRLRNAFGVGSDHLYLGHGRWPLRDQFTRRAGASAANAVARPWYRLSFTDGNLSALEHWARSN
jgi:hypothetical protein